MTYFTSGFLSQPSAMFLLVAVFDARWICVFKERPMKRSRSTYLIVESPMRTPSWWNIRFCRTSLFSDWPCPWSPPDSDSDMPSLSEGNEFGACTPDAWASAVDLCCRVVVMVVGCLGRVKVMSGAVDISDPGWDAALVTAGMGVCEVGRVPSISVPLVVKQHSCQRGAGYVMQQIAVRVLAVLRVLMPHTSDPGYPVPACALPP